MAPLPVREYGTPDSYAAAVAAAPGTYVRYEWPAAPQPLSTTMEVDHVWSTIPDGNATDGNGVFASSQMWWHDATGNTVAGGYMGSQVMRRGDGTERRVFIFSCWDHNKTSHVGWTTPQTCSRFGGEGVGSHCVLDYPIAAGTLYNFTLRLSGSNATGAEWTGSVLDTSSGHSTAVGTLFMPHADSATIGYGHIGISSNEFLEYFDGGDCDGAARVGVGTFGPFFRGKTVAPMAAAPAYGSGTCTRTLVTGCIPGWGCGFPRVWVAGGAGVVRNNTDQTILWRAPSAAASVVEGGAPGGAELDDALDDAHDGVTFHCVGACATPRAVKSKGGNALMGGHMYPGVTVESDLAAYRWFLERANGGDVLVLTADDAPCDLYNAFLLNMTGSLRPNSVTTACFTSRAGAADARLRALLGGASAIFVTGGDQAKYVEFWANTSVARALSSPGMAVGGSSAGLAVQGEFVFDAMHGGVTSEDALKYPTDSEVSLARAFVRVDEPWMRGVVMDTHFEQRDRMGRLVAFVARIARAGWARDDKQPKGRKGVLGVGISEHTAILVDPASGLAAFVGAGPAYFLSSQGREPTTCKEGKKLSWEAPGVAVWRWTAADAADNATWSFGSWAASPAGAGTAYSLTVHKGKLASTQPGGGIY